MATPNPKSIRPVWIASAVAAICLFALLVVDHGRWIWPQSAGLVRYPTTAAAAKAAGVTVTPTVPVLTLKSLAPYPKPAHARRGQTHRPSPVARAGPVAAVPIGIAARLKGVAAPRVSNVLGCSNIETHHGALKDIWYPLAPACRFSSGDTISSVA
jgi:hypothetical protein